MYIDQDITENQQCSTLVNHRSIPINYNLLAARIIGLTNVVNNSTLTLIKRNRTQFWMTDHGQKRLTMTSQS